MRLLEQNDEKSRRVLWLRDQEMQVLGWLVEGQEAMGTASVVQSLQLGLPETRMLNASLCPEAFTAANIWGGRGIIMGMTLEDASVFLCEGSWQYAINDSSCCVACAILLYLGSLCIRMSALRDQGWKKARKGESPFASRCKSFVWLAKAIWRLLHIWERITIVRYRNRSWVQKQHLSIVALFEIKRTSWRERCKLSPVLRCLLLRKSNPSQALSIRAFLFMSKNKNHNSIFLRRIETFTCHPMKNSSHYCGAVEMKNEFHICETCTRVHNGISVR